MVLIIVEIAGMAMVATAMENMVTASTDMVSMEIPQKIRDKYNYQIVAINPKNKNVLYIRERYS